MNLFKPRRPRIACEFTPTQLVVARLGENNSIDASALCELPPGALAADLTSTNILGRDVVSTAVQKTIPPIAGRHRDVAVVVPDASFRMALLELDVLPERPEEADTLVRLRLRKSLPFDVEKARVRWQAQKVNGATTVLAAAILTAVLEEYESIVREAGYNPGLVLPSMLACMRVADANVPTLLIKIDPTTTSIAIMNSFAVVLIRILNRAIGQRVKSTQLVNEVHSSLMFFQDTYKTKIQKILVSGTRPFEELNTALEESTGVCAQELGDLQQRVFAAQTLSPITLGAVSGALLRGM